MASRASARAAGSKRNRSGTRRTRRTRTICFYSPRRRWKGAGFGRGVTFFRPYAPSGWIFLLEYQQQFGDVESASASLGIGVRFAHRGGLALSAESGIIGQPRDGDARAGFAIADLDTTIVEFWRVPYEIAAVQSRMRAARLPEALVQRLSLGVSRTTNCLEFAVRIANARSTLDRCTSSLK